LREEWKYKHLVVTDDLEMGAISRHCSIGDAVVRAFNAGEDMLAICARPESIRAGYHALLAAARTGGVSRERIRASIRRIAALKSIVQPPLTLDLDHFNSLAGEIAALNKKLNYSYGGTI